MGEEEGDDDEGDDDNDESIIKPSRSFRSVSLLEEASQNHFGAILEAFLALLGPSWGPQGALWEEVWEASWGNRGHHGSKKESEMQVPPSRGPKMAC